MIYHNAPQGSEAWLESRRGVITGSRFKDARSRLADKPAKIDKKTGEIISPAVIGGPSAKAILYARDVARERCGGKVADIYVNGAMRFGQEQEPYARLAYETTTGYLVEEVGFVTTDDRMFGLSLDGRVANTKGAVEIKTMVSSDNLFNAVVNGDISEFIDQCNGGLLLLELDWIDLVLWTPDLESLGLGLFIIRIERDEAEIKALQDDLNLFAALVRENESKLRRLAAANLPMLQAA